MGNLSIFQLLLLAMLGIGYAIRTVVRRMKGKRLKDAPMQCVFAMVAWTAILAASGLGWTPSSLHLPFHALLRWIGFGVMLAAVLNSTIDWADLFASRMALSSAWHADFGSHRHELNSAFVSFVCCCFGAFLLSADLCVLVASVLTLFAMSHWVRHDNPRPA